MRTSPLVISRQDRMRRKERVSAMQIDITTHNSLIPLLAHVLRHDPDAHFLDLDTDGWASVEDVLLAIRCVSRITHGSYWVISVGKRLASGR